MSKEIAEIVRNARKIMKQNQQDFAISIGKTQSVLSRYESGQVQPPTNIVMHCMHIANTESYSSDIEQIIDKIRALEGEQYTKIREAISLLLDRCINH